MHKKKIIKIIKGISWYSLLLLLVIPFIFPLFWIFLSSFKTQKEIAAVPPAWFFVPTFQNYIRVLVEQNFFLYLFNSSLIAVSATLLSLVISGL